MQKERVVLLERVDISDVTITYNVFYILGMTLRYICKKHTDNPPR